MREAVGVGVVDGCGPHCSGVDRDTWGEKVPAEVGKAADAVREKIVGGWSPFVGELKDSKGNVKVAAGQKMTEIALDNTCECCRLGIAFAGPGRPAVVFRNIFPGSVRDHAVVHDGQAEHAAVSP